MVVAAGAIRFNFLKFLVVDGLAALVSGGLFVYLGYLAGKHLGSIEDVRKRIKHYEHYVLIGAILLGLLIVGYFVLRHRRIKAERRERELEHGGGTRMTAPAESPR
jgi:membrane protein DedA with SNARE-associated domain